MSTHRRNVVRMVACLALVLLATGCESIAALASVERPATIVWGNDTTVITAPDTATRSMPFQVRFNSFENGCTDPLLPPSVRQVADSIVIEPRVESNPRCAMDSMLFVQYEAAVSVTRTGRLVIHVVGRREVDGRATSASVSRAIYVR